MTLSASRLRRFAVLAVVAAVAAITAWPSSQSASGSSRPVAARAESVAVSLAKRPHRHAVHPRAAKRRHARRTASAHARQTRRLRAHRRAVHSRAPNTPRRAKRPKPIVAKANAPAEERKLDIPNDPAFGQEWSLAQVHAPQAWQLVASGHPVTVAVIDSGVDPSQPDLQGAVVAGHNFVDGSDDTSDQYGHGTMVAGVIAARTNNGIGVAGACSACLIMPIKVLGSTGSGTSTSIAAGMRWAVEHGALILNLSVALSGDDPAVADAVAFAHDRGVLVVAAAGNSGGTDTTFPASYPNVISVAGTDTSDHVYDWSTRGAWVTLAAPGCTVTTALGGTYAEFCGTSAAAPLVAGLAGLALATGVPSPRAVEEALQTTAQELPGLVGRGRVDAFGLVQRVGH